MQKAFSRNELIAIFFLFIIFYALLYFLSLIGNSLKDIPLLNFIFPLNAWDSPTFFLIPIAGFFLIFILIDWIKDYFNSNISFSWVFPVAFIILCLLAFYVNLFFYFYPSFQKAFLAICVLDESSCNNWQQSLVQKYESQGTPVVFIRYWSEFKSNAFPYFMFAGVFAWLSHFILRKLKASQLI